MKIWIQCAAAVLIMSSAGAHAAGKLGAGFVLGGPTALSGKWYKSDEQAFDLQFAFFHDDYFLIYGDYLRHFPKMFKSNEEFVRQLSPYVGVGPFFAIATDDDYRHRNNRARYFDDTDDDFAMGVRVPFGIEWLSDDIPLGVGVEIAPGIIFAPSTEGLVHAGLSIRYYF